MKLRNSMLLALGFIFFNSAYAELRMIRCVYGGDSDHPKDLVYDLETGTAEVRSHTLKSGKLVGITYNAKVEEFPTKLRFTWKEAPLVPGVSDYHKATLDVDRRTLKAFGFWLSVGGTLSGHVYENKSAYECTVEKISNGKNKI